MTIIEMIKKYDIVMTHERDAIVARDAYSFKRDNAYDIVAPHKDEILQYLKEKEEERERAFFERRRKIDAIEGLKEIEDARAQLSDWNYRFKKSFDGEGAVGGMGVGAKPDYDLEEMYKKYPVAHAYLTAEAQENKSNYELSAIGKRAKEQIINNPGNYKEIIENMQSEIKDFTQRHLWD